MLKKIYNKILEHPVLSLIIYAVIIRVLVLFFYDGYTIVNDSQDYIDLGKKLTEFNLNGYTGQRTPGFPILIALANNNLQLVAYFQLILGVLSTYFIYDISRLRTHKTSIALLIAALTTSFMHYVYFELAIMTETSTLFVLILTFWFMLKYNVLEINSSILKLILLSILCACLYLIRPMFIYIPMLLAIFFTFKNFKQDYKKAFSKSLIIVVLPIMAFYSWSSLNEKNIGVFGSTYYLGINLSQNATTFFEKAPEDDALIRDIFVKHRDSIKINEPDRLAMSVWFAYDELIEKTELSPPELSTKLGEISKYLFKKYPELYFKQVFISWKDFWTDYMVWNPEKVTNKHVRKGLIGLWIIIQQYVSLLINIIFLVFAFKKIILFIKNRFKTFDFELLLVATIILGSLAQALVTYGSNGRFSFPYFPLIVYFVIVNLIALKDKYVRDTST